MSFPAPKITIYHANATGRVTRREVGKNLYCYGTREKTSFPRTVITNLCDWTKIYVHKRKRSVNTHTQTHILHIPHMHASGTNLQTFTKTLSHYSIGNNTFLANANSLLTLLFHLILITQNNEFVPKPFENIRTLIHQTGTVQLE